MDDLKDLRAQLDQLDTQIFTLLDQRFDLSKKVKAVKARKSLQVNDPSREQKIISRIDEYMNADSIKVVYESVFKASKALQEKNDS